MKIEKNNIFRLAASIIVCQLAGAFGSIFTAKTVSTWYLTLNKPFFNPPGWLFGPVWITLYTLMGIALYFVLSKGLDRIEVKNAFFVFAAQLALNALWSVLFFGLRNPMLAFFEIILLWASILVSIFLFYRIDRKAAYLLIPYILWVSFAAVLNCAIWLLN
ncbi:MAG: TspO/MBR family protein [archaeon]